MCVCGRAPYSTVHHSRLDSAVAQIQVQRLYSDYGMRFDDLSRNGPSHLTRAVPNPGLIPIAFSAARGLAYTETNDSMVSALRDLSHVDAAIFAVKIRSGDYQPLPSSALTSERFHQPPPEAWNNAAVSA